jgi:hypothetical protein
MPGGSRAASIVLWSREGAGTARLAEVFIAATKNAGNFAFSMNIA